MPLKIVPIADRVLSLLYLIVGFSAAMAGKSMEAFLWVFSALLLFCACYQQARAEHYKTLCQRAAEDIYEAQLATRKDHS